MNCELDIGTARVDTDLTQTSNGGVAQPLILLVGQGQGRRDRDRIAGVDAHGVDVLDGADDDAIVRMVANHLHFVFFPTEQRLLDEDLAEGREGEAALDRLDQLGARGCNAAAFAAKGEGGANDRRQADSLERGKSLIDGADELAARALDPDAFHGLAEAFSRPRLVDDIRVGADHFDAMALEYTGARQFHGEVKRRLATQCWQYRVEPLLFDDALDHLRYERLDVGGVGQLGIGHDRGGLEFTRITRYPSAFSALQACAPE